MSAIVQKTIVQKKIVQKKMVQKKMVQKTFVQKTFVPGTIGFAQGSIWWTRHIRISGFCVLVELAV